MKVVTNWDWLIPVWQNSPMSSECAARAFTLVMTEFWEYNAHAVRGTFHKCACVNGTTPASWMSAPTLAQERARFFMLRHFLVVVCFDGARCLAIDDPIPSAFSRAGNYSPTSDILWPRPLSEQNSIWSEQLHSCTITRPLTFTQKFLCNCLIRVLLGCSFCIRVLSVYWLFFDLRYVINVRSKSRKGRTTVRVLIIVEFSLFNIWKISVHLAKLPWSVVWSMEVVCFSEGSNVLNMC